MFKQTKLDISAVTIYQLFFGNWSFSINIIVLLCILAESS